MKTKDETDAKTMELVTAAFQKLPKRITCPKCKKSRAKDAFGMRIMSRSADGTPTRITKQSWCRNCRG